MADFSNPIELAAHRRITAAYIEAEPARIVLKRPAKVQTAAGGFTEGPPVDQDPQDFRLIPFKRRLTEITRNTPDGDIHSLLYVLLGVYDANVQKGDFFEYEGKRYEVESLEPNTSYRQLWNITYRGPVNAT